MVRAKLCSATSRRSSFEQAARILALTRPTLRSFSQAGRQLSASAAAAKDRKFAAPLSPLQQQEQHEHLALRLADAAPI